MAHEMPEEMLFDKRLVDRHIRQGLTTREKYDAWLQQQPDLSPEADTVKVEGLAVVERIGGGSHRH